MNKKNMDRRSVLKLLSAAAGFSMLPEISMGAPAIPAAPGFTYCLNMATIRGHNLGLVKELETAHKAGFSSVEIWMDTLEKYLSGGGKLKALKQRIDDAGMHIENAIGFAPWIVDDDTQRAKGIEQLKKEMEQLAALGCKRTAAPPAGATEKRGLDLDKAAERYRAILELGKQTGVVPQLEMWGFSANLSKLGELLYVAAGAGQSSARLLLDVFHMYKGGTSVNALSLVNPHATEVFHVNDYPATIAAEAITDADRIYPGDGVAPIRDILSKLKSPDRPLVISFEVFNKGYYKQDPVVVASTALSKMKKITRGL